jgi:hypothetical protein
MDRRMRSCCTDEQRGDPDGKNPLPGALRGGGRGGNVSPIGDGVDMDEDGSTGEARTRLARGTTPNALQGKRDGAVDTAAPGGSAPREPASGVLQGSGPVLARGTDGCVAQGAATDEPAHSIQEAVEQLIGAREADEAIAEWMTGGG